MNIIARIVIITINTIISIIKNINTTNIINIINGTMAMTMMIGMTMMKYIEMRKILIFLGLLFVMLSNIYAQKGRQAIGFGLSYGTEIESIGLGLKYQYNITNPIRLEPSLNYFIENDNVSMLDVNMNLHYLCPVGRSVKLYPLFGFTFSNWMFDLGDGFDIDVDGDHIHIDKDDDHHNECRVGVNIGGGADFVLTNNWIMNFELRYQLVSDFDQAVFNLGFAYRF